MALARHTGCPNPQGRRSQLEAVLRYDRGQLPEPPEVEGSADS